jgi:hypothetical protein
MHTATSLSVEHFSIEIAGHRASREALFAGRPHERFGIVVHTPLGALGASLLIELAVTAYYDARDRRRRTQPLYPEIYAFHVGGRYGNYSPMDFWPARKEVFLGDAAEDVLESINSHAITHLAVPDGAPNPAEHRFKEPAAAFDRLERCFVYDPSGRVAGGEIAIRALHKSLWTDVDYVIDGGSGIETGTGADHSPADPIRQQSSVEYLRRLRERRGEVSPADRALAVMRRLALHDGTTLVETFRNTTAGDALERLGRSVC